jgi:hypothetical protein
MTLPMGKREMELPGRYLGELREANADLADVAALRGRSSHPASMAASAAAITT